MYTLLLIIITGSGAVSQQTISMDTKQTCETNAKLFEVSLKPHSGTFYGNSDIMSRTAICLPTQQTMAMLELKVINKFRNLTME